MSIEVFFDYDALDMETRVVVQQKTVEIREWVRRTRQDVIEIGERLIEVKGRLGHGRFGEWVRAEFQWSDRTAQSFMNVAAAFKSEIISDLDVTPSALCILSAPSVPEDARKEAVEQARNGKHIGTKEAKAITDRHKAESPRGTDPRSESGPSLFANDPADSAEQAEPASTGEVHQSTSETPKSTLRKGADGKTRSDPATKKPATQGNSSPNLCQNSDKGAAGKPSVVPPEDGPEEEHEREGVEAGEPEDEDETGDGDFHCLICSEAFSEEVWHCRACDHHWPLDVSACLNCYADPRRKEEGSQGDENDPAGDGGTGDGSQNDRPSGRSGKADKGGFPALWKNIDAFLRSLPRRGGVVALMQKLRFSRAAITGTYGDFERLRDQLDQEMHQMEETYPWLDKT